MGCCVSRDTGDAVGCLDGTMFATGEKVIVVVDGASVEVGLLGVTGAAVVSTMRAVGRAVMIGERVSTWAVGGLDAVGFSTFIGWYVGM